MSNYHPTRHPIKSRQKQVGIWWVLWIVTNRERNIAWSLMGSERWERISLLGKCGSFSLQAGQKLQCDKWPVLPGAEADNLRASCPGDEQISARGKIPESRTKRLNGSLCEKRDTLLFENSTLFELQGDDGVSGLEAWPQTRLVINVAAPGRKRKLNFVSILRSIDIVRKISCQTNLQLTTSHPPCKYLI